MSLERRVAVLYLVRLLTGAATAELGNRRVRRVAFQQAPEHRVDDLVIEAALDDGTSPLSLAVAARRKPTFRTSDVDTEKLVGDLISELRTTTDGIETRMAVYVAGLQGPADQIARLAHEARTQHTAESFIALVRTPGRFDKLTVDRLDHLLNLVAANLSTPGVEPEPSEVGQVTWRLLNHLDVRMCRVEPPDETDWAELVADLQPWAREPTTTSASALRDRLESLAATYAPAAAAIDLQTLRRDTHDALNNECRRHAVGWTELRRLEAEARASVRNTVGLGEGRLHLPRQAAADVVRSEVHGGAPILVTGESGCGKSALVLDVIDALSGAEPAACQSVLVNLRLLPATMAELRIALTAPLEELLAEMSAPVRLLVLDGAEIAIERDGNLLNSLLRAARDTDVTPWVLCANHARSSVRTAVENTGHTPNDIVVEGLHDADLDAVAEHFPALQHLVAEPRAKELLRRPAVVDLFVRSGSRAVPLSDADALRIVWNRLVRRDGQAFAGRPDARDAVMRELARFELQGGESPNAPAALDQAAVDGLTRDVLVRSPDRWQVVPVFAHDLLRTYAVARTLLAADDPVGALLRYHAPRWTLPAARLAFQDRLGDPDGAATPVPGRYRRAQHEADRLTASGHGDRWGDLPVEALLAVPNAATLLDDAWAELAADDAAGLSRLLRVLEQRHVREGMVNRLVAEPVVAPLLRHGWPPQLHEAVHRLLRAWLSHLALASEPAGHPLRIALRDRLVARVAAGDERVARERAGRDQGSEPASEADLFAYISLSGHRRRRRSEVPSELIDDELLEELALLGADLSEEGADLLRRLAREAAHRLAPAVDDLIAGHALAGYDTSLLAELIEAYYIDQDYRDHIGLGNEGIRHHERGGVLPMAASFRGPFLALLRADLLVGVRTVNRMLNHAARARVRDLGSPSWGDPPGLAYETELDIAEERRAYVGDMHVWLWYRGTGVGPYPCMSALMALERVADEVLAFGDPVADLVRLLLEGCQNLAMPALIVGVLLRHLDDVGDALDPFLIEPTVWHLEVARLTHESSGLAAQMDGLEGLERRQWSLHDAAAWLVVHASDERALALRALGQHLLVRALEQVDSAGGDVAIERERAVVRRWAASLDRDNYRAREVEEGIVIEQVVDDEVAEVLAPSNDELTRDRTALRFTTDYPERYDRHRPRRQASKDQILADLRTARALVESPSSGSVFNEDDAAAHVAAAALEMHFRDEWDIPDVEVTWAAECLVAAVRRIDARGNAEDDTSVFSQNADRAAARGLPLLLLPTATSVREHLDEQGTDAGALQRALSWIVESATNETRLFLARSLDAIWRTPCDTTTDRCHHATALALVEDVSRYCLIGPWDPSLERLRLAPRAGH